MAADLTDGMEAETVNGGMLTFDLSGDPMVNESMIVDTDIEATNGVIHVIDSVLVPDNFELQEVDMEEDEVPQTGIESNSILLFSMIAVAAAFVFVLVYKPLKQDK